MEDVVSTFGLKAENLIVMARDTIHATTEVKGIILYYPYTPQVIVDEHCEILWADNSGAGLGRHPTANHGAGLDNLTKQAMIYQQCRRYKMLGLWINFF